VQTARILCVGGDDADLAILTHALRGAGNTDVRRGTPDDALAAINARAADLLLLDLGLPSADVVRVLQAAAPGGGARTRVATIVLAPAGMEQRVETCLQHGAEDFLTTPLDASRTLSITRRISLCLQRRWLRDATVRMQTRGPARLDETAVIELYTNASSRFVPREFLEHLGRKAITDVRLGDHVEREMSILFTDIRDFTALSETLTPQQNFDFLNSYLRHVTPIVRARHGFVDKYIGDAIMALFPRGPGDALQAAVELQRQVELYNLGRRSAGYVPIRIGIGVHHGSLILGTVGEEERMQTTVISDAVNVASRIEGLTKVYGVSLLVSGSVIEGIDPQLRCEYRLRNLGEVKAKGKTRSVEIFECYDNDPDSLRAHKDGTAEAFAAGMIEFRRGMFITAGRMFARIAQLDPSDTVAAHFRDSCALTEMRKLSPGHFDGAERIEVT
jgi:class 3 adenylate cyclase